MASVIRQDILQKAVLKNSEAGYTVRVSSGDWGKGN